MAVEQPSAWEALGWAVLGALIVGELDAVSPVLSRMIVRGAARLLTGEDRERYEEEWLGRLHDMPGKLVKIGFALGCWHTLAREGFLTGYAVRGLTMLTALAMVVFVAPLYTLIATALLASGVTPLLRTPTVGLGGKVYDALSFSVFDRNRQVTRLGQFLWRSSLHLLPMIDNVMKGQMAFVGPRPVSQVGAEKMGWNLKEYENYKPGICWPSFGLGLAGQARVDFDVEYMKSRTLTSDLRLIFVTYVVGVFVRKAA